MPGHTSPREIRSAPHCLVLLSPNVRKTGPDRRAFVFVMGSMACRGPGGTPSDHSTQECHTGDSVRGFVRGRDFAMQRLAGAPRRRPDRACVRNG
ncbi:uncharacterized protein BCN122_II1139 [Burkholderia cenocepacia]|nr:uncharacterized protein BCN122_II1139 [Burkholderia cenocepacia]